MWSYFGNGYEKGVHDRDGVVLKQEIYKEQMRMDSEQLQNAADVVAFYEREQNEQHAAYPNARRDGVCYLHLRKPKDMDDRTSWDCKKIDESCSMHSVTFVSHLNNTLLNVRDLACFCMDYNSEFCNTHVKP
jgi:hypothetical protein